jgi:pilus assembly protein CpaE
VETLAEAGQALDVSERLVVLGPGVEFEHALRFASDIRLSGHDARLVLVRESVTDALRTRATEAGINAVVAANDRVALTAAYRRAALPKRVAGRVITVLGARDGYGKTTVAVNLAAALARREGTRVCLVDLDLAFGDLIGSLPVEPDLSLALTVAYSPGVTAEMIRSLATPVLPGLDCVVAATRPGEAARLPTAAVGELLALLPASYDFVVVDTVERHPAHTLSASDRAHHHVLVTAPELPALRRLRFTLDVLDALPYGRTTRSVVINRVHLGNSLSTLDMEEILKVPVAAELPSTADIPDAVNRGEILVSARPHHPFSTAILGLAERIAQHRKETPKEKRRRHA